MADRYKLSAVASRHQLAADSQFNGTGNALLPGRQTARHSGGGRSYPVFAYPGGSTRVYYNVTDMPDSEERKVGNFFRVRFGEMIFLPPFRQSRSAVAMWNELLTIF
jgi:hypothetical protein